MIIAHVDGFLPVVLCVVSLLSSEECSQFDRFHPQHIQMVKKTNCFKTKVIGNNAMASRVNCNIL